MPDKAEQKPRFICDDNMGKLARYLRVGGFDTLFENDINNSRLIQLSLDDRRYILTRDRRLIERRLVRYFLLIEDDLWPNQLKTVLQHFDLKFTADGMFSRCLEDNTVIIPVAKEAIRELVYPYTYEHHYDFRQCPACNRVFWSGSHTKAIINNLRKAGILIED